MQYTHTNKTRRDNCSSRERSSGFTLIEMMVAVGLFAVVMTISIGSLLSLVNANRKAQSLQTVVNNLNVALDSMVRSIRMGYNYHCIASGGITDPQNCQMGDTYLAFESENGDTTNPNDQWVYQYVPGSGTIPGYIEKSVDSGGHWIPITAAGITIESAKFYVVGSTPGSQGDLVQPKVVIEIQGEAGIPGTKTSTTFHIQATAVQRALDI